MKKKTFRGGVHPEYAKDITAEKSIQDLPAPEMIVISLQQHIGAPVDSLVKKGDSVLMGQLIGNSSYAVSANVHSSVSGTVVAVEPRPHISGRSVISVVIKNDGQDNPCEMISHSDPIQLSPQEIKDKIKAAGIVGLGGAAFPTSIKLDPPDQANIDYLIINGSECEPYLTADDRMMVEEPADVILGAKLLAKGCGAERILIGIEENKPEAIRNMRDHAGSNAIEIVVLDTKYPQGGEKQMITALTGREVPSNGLPYQAGVIVQNVGTALATTQACRDGRALIDRVVTLTGAGIKEPRNYRIRLGTSFRVAIEAAGGFTAEPGKVIAGGPLMGSAQFDLDVPVMKGTSSILVFTKEDSKQFDPMPCIKCARCVDVCPASLLPVRLEAYSMNAMWDEALEYGAMDCIECGCCTYICPSKRFLLHWMRLAKNEIIVAKRRQTG